ncbi:echinoderm microtubule-associated protein-like 2 isoform X2 [Paramormyrops kingsleyae]|uniref:echinoderm microtubule-associated protein-like 2 isoform X2 n=1 Tax=Paramormyrops kingsleyae TaxID=1676925 RepID=UPI003B96EA45
MLSTWYSPGYKQDMFYDRSRGCGPELPDKLSLMEVRLRAQEDEVTLLKSSLADALRKLRIHEQQTHLLWQELSAVNPAAAETLGQFCHVNVLSSYSITPRQRRQSQELLGTFSAPEGDMDGSGATICPQGSRPRPAAADRATQTEPSERVLLARTRAVQSLSLEDAFSDSEREDQGGGDAACSTWTAVVEEPIHESCVTALCQNWPEQDLSSADECLSEQSPLSTTMDLSSPAVPKDQTPSNRVIAVSSPADTQKKLLMRRNTERLVKDAPEKPRQKLARKVVSSNNLLSHSNSLEGRSKEHIYGAGTSRRGTYSQGQSVKMFIRGRPITMYVPSNFQNYEELRMEPPMERLELDWVYGYRGRDCRANLYMLPSGEAVYFTACVVVLHHIHSHRQRHYCRHTDCVRCLAIHPDQVRVASGQMAGVDKDGKPLLPFVHIWDSATLVTLQEIGLGSFERGVSSVAFSHADGGVFLAAIDDSNEHMLTVWDCLKGTKQTEIKSTNEAVFAVEFSPSDSSNIITCGKSHVYFWTMSTGGLTKKQGIFGKYKKPKFIQCFVFSLTGDVLTGDSEGSILTWCKLAADVKTLGKGAKETYQIVRQTQAHEGSVFTLCVLQGGTLLSGGGKDRRVVCWTVDLVPERECEIPEKYGAVRTIVHVGGEELLVGTTRNAILRGTFSHGFVAIVQGHMDEMWGLTTHPSQNIFLTCGHDRQVFFWNGEEHRMEWCAMLEESGLCADFCPNGSVVSLGLSTGRWLVLDLQTRHIVSDYTDGNEQLSVMRYSPDGSFLAVGSHDNVIYIYSVTEGGHHYTRFGKCTGHSSFITHLDWSKDGKYIMSNSGDYEILYWDVARGCRLLRNRYDSRDREWASYTCVLGFHVMGVWPEGSDGTDINALCRSHCERMVAVADDFCKVHLFQYPCPKPKAPSHRYEGHGSHVTNVDFTHNDSHLLSMGGKDTTILQWRVRWGGTEMLGTQATNQQIRAEQRAVQSALPALDTSVG